MIRKFLLFVGLMAIGLGIMHFVIGWENFARIREGDGAKPIKERERGDTGFVVAPLGDESSDAIIVAGRGALRIPHSKEIELPNGGRRLLTTYVLSAANSRPDQTEPDRMTLLDVEVEFFDIDEDDPANPRAIHSGTLEAATADIVVGRDEAGRPSVLEDRDMDLTDVVLKTVPSSKIPPVELRVARVLLRHTETGLTMRTPDPRAPFTITVGGSDPMTVTGEGLEAVLPSDDAPADAKRVLELHVAANPVLVRGSSTLRATGPLDYVEDMTTGIGEIDLRERVRADGLIGSTAGQEITVSGDAIRASVARRQSRDKRRGDSRAGAWLSFRLIGRPAKLTGRGVELNCTRVDVSPAIDGEPAIFTASGAPVLRQSENDATFEARRIHLVRVRRHLAALHRPFGFGDRFGRLNGELLVFEDAATVDEGRSGSTIRASNGLQVLRSEDPDGPLLSIGRGNVELDREGLQATGNDGFRLVQTTSRQSLRLGPAEPSAEHEFEVTRAGERPVAVSGRGSCEVEQHTDGRIVVALRSPDGSLNANLDGGQLADAASLDADIAPNGAVTGFVATGSPCRIARDTTEGRIEGAGTNLRRIQGGYRLIGSPATITRAGDEGAVRGDEIRVFEWGRSRLALVATSGGGERAHVTVRPPSREKPLEPVSLDADRVEFLPFRVPDLVLSAHAGGRLLGGRTAFAAPLRAEEVVARGHIDVLQRGERELVARGDTFRTRLDGSAGLLLGAPSQVRLLAEDGREVTAIAEAIRIAGETEGRERLELLRTPNRDPVVFVRGAEGSTGGIGRVRIACTGEIDADREDISFRGPVHAREVDEDGEPVANGLDLDAQALELDADENGSIRELIASGDVDMNLRGARALGDHLVLDVPAARAKLRRAIGYAEVRMPNGKRVLGRQLEVDYERMLVTGWMIRIEEP